MPVEQYFEHSEIINDWLNLDTTPLRKQQHFAKHIFIYLLINF